MARNSADPDLYLLLEDYGRHPSQGGEEGRSSQIASQLGRGPLNAHYAPGPPIRLLLEDYPGRTQEWLNRFKPVQVSAAPLDQNGAAGDLRILLEEYDPAARFLLRWRHGAGGHPAASKSPTRGGLPAEAAPAVRRGASPRRARTGKSAGPDREPRAAEPALATRAEAPELNLLLNWGEFVFGGHYWQARWGSLAAHALLIALLITQPYILPSPPTENFEDMGIITLSAPPASVLAELTQPAPTKGPVTPRFSGAPEQPRPLINPTLTPESAPPVLAPPEPPKPEKKPAPDPPGGKPEAADESQPKQPTPAAQSPAPGIFRPATEMAQKRQPNELPAPRSSKPAAKPKLELEDAKASMPSREGPLQLGSLELNARPDRMIEGAMEDVIRSGGGKQAVGDGYGAGGMGGYLPPSPGNAGSSLELLSDPKGVDFRPYLMQLLAAVRRNWHAVLPESARLGMTKGRVSIQFSVARNGSVPKLVIASSSGVQSLDRAAVAGISASLPFPPIPSQYAGSEIRLQFAFLYNVKTR